MFGVLGSLSAAQRTILVTPLVVLFTSTMPADAQSRGAYNLLEHWNIPCSGHGGFGDKVIVRSHRQADLEAAFRIWYTMHVRDKGQCLSFMAFSSMASYDATNHPSRYTDAQLDAIPTGLNYYNNPNTGYEGWGVGGGPEHHGGPR